MALVLKISDLSRISEQNKMTKNIKERQRGMFKGLHKPKAQTCWG